MILYTFSMWQKCRVSGTFQGFTPQDHTLKDPLTLNNFVLSLITIHNDPTYIGIMLYVHL